MPDQTKAKQYEVGKVYPLDIDMLKPNPFQVRKYFDEEAIEAASCRVLFFWLS